MNTVARHERETRRADAAIVRAAKVREPIDEAERYLNAVLEDVAMRIERGPKNAAQVLAGVRTAALTEAADAIAVDRDTTRPGGGKGAYRRAMTRAEQVVRDMALDTDLTEGGIDQMMTAGTPVEIATADCERCGGPVEWTDCPTGGWWAHRLHPADGHDAAPPLRDRYVVALKGELDEEPQPATAERLANAVVEVNEAADRGDTAPVPREALCGLVEVAEYVAPGRHGVDPTEPYPDEEATRALAALDGAGLLDQFREDSDG